MGNAVKIIPYVLILIGGLTLTIVPVRAEISSEVAEDRIRLAAKHLLKVQRSDGLLNYQYDFIKGRWRNQNNIIRQTGAGFALAEYFKATRNDEVKGGLIRALKAYESLSIAFGPGLVVAAGGQLSLAKTGATALALLTELFCFEATRDPQFDGLRQGWFRALQALHLKGRGFMKGPRNFEDSSYYNGEVWLALAHYARLFGTDGKAQEILEDVDASFIERYTEEPHIGFYHWGTMAAVVRFESTGAKRYLDFIRGQTTAFLDRLRPAVKPQSNACYSVEGLSAAATVIGRQSHGDSSLRKRLLQRIEAEIRKSLSFQIMPGQSRLEFGGSRVLYSDDLKNFVGAFVDGLFRPRARIDSTQHCLSALLKFVALRKGN